MTDFNTILFVASFLILASVIVARLVDNIGIPTLLLFLGIGIVAHSERLVEFGFATPALTQYIATIALIFIIFAGGLETQWHQVKPILRYGITLATGGVLITALVVALFAWKVLGYSLLEGLLLGSIISSTDAPAVFSILRSKKVSLKGTLKPLLEFESGSNDPTAMFLTLTMVAAVNTGQIAVGGMIVTFVLQMCIGIVVGIVFGRLVVTLVNSIRFSYEGFYPVSVFAAAVGIYASSSLVGGNGILAVYLAGIVIGNSEIVHKKSLLRFFDGLAWLSQITMFLVLGFLVTPKEVFSHAQGGFIVSAVLIFLARPLGVFLSLVPSRFNIREKFFLSWVGIRGAMPIILSTFLMTTQLPQSIEFVRIVFFIVLTSALVQGWSIPYVARLLGVDAPQPQIQRFPLEFETPQGSDTELYDFIVPYNSTATSKPIVELGLPKGTLIVLIIRNEKYIVPSGGTILEPGDTILALVKKAHLEDFRKVITTGEGTEFFPL
ncbi:MAG: potassium/proton antiporter [Bacteroidetes bacterium]|nr:potassium/proton antiporter [Bacteroidota bacterium]